MMSGKTAERTDVANAEKLIDLYGADIRYVGTWSKWLVWDGQRWLVDATDAIQRFAVRTARVLFESALEHMRTAQTDAQRKTAEAELGWAIQTQNAARLASMTKVARSASEIAIRHERLDADRMLFNVANGTVDLRTGKLRAHERGDLLTKLAPAEYDPDAKCPLWDAFLLRVMGDDAAMVEYLQRLSGYALTGEIREHVLAFFFGRGANGKSTFLRTLHTVLGDYASPAPRGLLFRARGGERHPTELASLHGRRFVTCSEIEEGQSFDEALVKDLTGGDPIECRRMREDFWSFEPTHKLFIAGNHKPSVRGDDEGIWRRMKLVPWVVTFAAHEQDKQLAEKLLTEAPGILAWCVRGCLDWQAKGLSEPAAVSAATKGYREESDGLGEFFRLSAVFEPGASVARKDLREAYETHCRENGAEPLGAKRFAGRLRERGVTETAIRKGVSVVNGWKGIRFSTDAEKTASAVWNDRRHVGTCSDQIPVSPNFSSSRTNNPESVPTSTNIPTSVEAGETLQEWLTAQRIGGEQ